VAVAVGVAVGVIVDTAATLCVLGFFTESEGLIEAQSVEHPDRSTGRARRDAARAAVRRRRPGTGLLLPVRR
jgi:hypothetical protein